MPDGSEQPIGYVSRTLNSAECNYSQLEKEGLSCVYRIKWFYAYLYRHPFMLITDHKPLLGLLDGQKPTSPQTAARVLRWSLYMSTFEYTLKFRNTAAHSNAESFESFTFTCGTCSSSASPRVSFTCRPLVKLTCYC